MTNEEQLKKFAFNLKFYIANSGKSQKEVAQDLGFNQTTFNTWCVGKILPSLGKIQMIADYFGIGKSDLLGESDSRYHFDDETAELAQEMFDNKDLRFLMKSARGCKPEHIRNAAELLNALKATNPDE